MDNIVSKTYKEINDVFGLPQEYKGIKIYPLKMKEEEYIELMYSLLAQPKNHIPVKEIIKMSYLKFLLYVVFYKKKTYIEVGNDLKKLLSYVMKTDKISLDGKIEDRPGDQFDRMSLFLKIDDVILQEDEFRHIREIILEQNGIGVKVIDDFDPSLEDAFQSFNKMGQGGQESITLSDEIFTFCALMNKDVYETSDYTLFQFKMQMEKAMALLNYKLYRPLEAAGEIEVKGGKIPHFLYHSNRNRGRYDSMMVSKKEFLKSDIFKVASGV